MPKSKQTKRRRLALPEAVRAVLAPPADKPKAARRGRPAPAR